MAKTETMLTKEVISQWFMSLQNSICQALEKADGGGVFEEDHWQRQGGGGGRTRVMRNGAIIEKGGVNFSAVWGATPDKIQESLGLKQAEFYATGVSIVIHPHNPRVPIIHKNVRYFEMSNGAWWFGGGIDLTPHYVDKDDARHFHTQLKAVCDQFNPNYYPKFKLWADDYFYLRHRDETRGVGGIFFDHLNEEAGGTTKEELWHFVQEAANSFVPVYTYFMKKNHPIPFDEREKEWQLLRRGRYVEFNLVLDKGTRFGLDTDGRTESILMSLPPLAGWEYNYQPSPGSPEQATLDLLKKGINWLTA